QRSQPAVVGTAPRGLALVANVVAQQEALELMAGLDAAVDCVFARPRQITDRFVVRIGDPHGAQLARARAFGQLNAVARISLDAVAWTSRHLRWRNDLAGVTLGLQGTLQTEACRTSL